MVESKNIVDPAKKLARMEKFPFLDLKLNAKRADICVARNDGMPEEYHHICQVSLQEALMQPKEELYEVADIVVKRLIDNTDEARWLCHIYPAGVDSGLSYLRKGSICLQFGPPDIQYECRIACLF